MLRATEALPAIFIQGDLSEAPTQVILHSTSGQRTCVRPTQRDRDTVDRCQRGVDAILHALTTAILALDSALDAGGNLDGLNYALGVANAALRKVNWAYAHFNTIICNAQVR